MFSFSKFVRRSTLVVCAVAAGVTVHAQAFAENSLERAQKNGFIRVGFANEAPYGFATSSGKLTGEAPEVARAVFAKLGIKQIDGVLTEFGALIPGLKAKRFDVIAAGMYINPKRCKQILFSEPSYGIGQAFLIKEGNPKKLKDYASIAGDGNLKLAVLSGAVEGGYAKSSGVKRTQLVSLPDQASMVKAVQAGRVDAAALSALSIAGMAQKVDGLISTAPFGTVAGRSVKGHGGFGFRKEDTALRDAFNAELKKFLGSKEHLDLVTPLGFGEGYMPNKTMTELCAE